jgi:hypothetical protein
LIAGVLIIIYIDYNDFSLSIHSHSKSIDTTASSLEHPRILLSAYPTTIHINPFMQGPFTLCKLSTYTVYVKGVCVTVPIDVYLLKPSFWLVYKSAVFARDLIISVMVYSRIQ